MKKCIVVPYDFSEPAQNALKKAYEIAKQIEKPIVLIHIVKRDNEIEAKQSELDNVASEFLKEKDDNIKIKAVVKKGSLFKEIYETAQEYNAYLAVMGTHGKKTIKKAMKVVSKFVKIAFLLVQYPEDKLIFNKILLPLDTNKKTRANLNWIKSLSYHFELKVFLLYPVYKSDSKNSLVKRNLSFAEKILDRELIDYKVIRADIDNNFTNEIFNKIREYEIDTLTLMSTNYKGYIKQIKKEEDLDQYKKTPILCVNPRIDLEKLAGLT
ncbi:MAG: universal stress protein [Bacteroidota bacterium]|nr:universal stress protein [Bacteroidota bacterium]